MSPNGVRPILNLFFLMIRQPPWSPLFPYTTLFRSLGAASLDDIRDFFSTWYRPDNCVLTIVGTQLSGRYRSEEHTSELQSRFDLVCRLLLEKKIFILCISRFYIHITVFQFLICLFL